MAEKLTGLSSGGQICISPHSSHDLYIKNMSLFLNVGTKAFTYTLLSYLQHTDLTLVKHLKQWKDKLLMLKENHVLDEKQWSLLFPYGETNVKTYDLSLLSLLLENTIPETWKIGSSVLKYVNTVHRERNRCFHVPATNCTSSKELMQIWNRMSKTIVDLTNLVDPTVTDGIKKEINNIYISGRADPLPEEEKLEGEAAGKQYSKSMQTDAREFGRDEALGYDVTKYSHSLSKNKKKWVEKSGLAPLNFEVKDELTQERDKNMHLLEEMKKVKDELTQERDKNMHLLEEMKKKYEELQQEREKNKCLESQLKEVCLLERQIKEISEMNLLKSFTRFHSEKLKELEDESTMSSELSKKITEKDKEIEDLNEQVRDLMLHVEARNKLDEVKDVSKEDIKEGQIIVGAASSTKKASGRRSRKKPR